MAPSAPQTRCLVPGRERRTRPGAHLRAVGAVVAVLVQVAEAGAQEPPRYVLDDWCGEQDMRSFGDALLAAGDVDGDGFGDLAVGSPGDYDFDSSAVYVYAGGPDSPSMVPALLLRMAVGGTGFGEELAGGDLDGDGYADVVTGEDTLDDSTGRVSVRLGGPGGLASEPVTVLDGATVGDRLGRELVSAGDVDGDGLADVAVGHYSGGYLADVYTGGAGGLDAGRLYPLDPALAGRFSGSLAGPGDANGDGYDDVAAGGYTASGTWSATVYHGGPSGPTSASTVSGTSDPRSTTYAVVYAAGDADGDGFADLVVDVGDHLEEALGGAAGIDPTAAVVFDVDGLVATLGDLDGDGRDELAVATTRTLAVFGGSGAGSDPTARQELPTPEDWGSTQFTNLASADLDADGAKELYAVGYDWYAPVWQYTASGGALTTDPTRTIVTPAPALIHPHVALPGDVDGDGFEDALVGMADGADGGGIVYLWRGGEDGLAAAPSAFDIGGEDAYGLGMVLAGLGDVNGDGLADVGSRAMVDGDRPDFLRVYLGSPDASLVGVDVDSPDAAGEFASAFVPVGDLDGDGRGDVLVADRYADGFAGAIYLYDGAPGGLDPSPVAEWAGATASQQLGRALVVADVDGDGRTDFMAGEAGDAGLAGGLRLYPGSAAGFEATESWSYIGEADGDGLGDALAAGDVDGDGYPDLVAGAPGRSTGAGALFVFLGGAGGFDAAPAQVLAGGAALGDRGSSVATLGDIDGDGTVEVGTTDRHVGGALVYFGSPTGLEAAPSMVLNQWGDPHAVMTAGDMRAVLAAGDLTHDGAGDVLVTAEYAVGLFDGLPAPVDTDGDGWTTPSDCDDLHADVRPGAVERCDGRDDDCDGTTDEGAVDASRWYGDADGDGWGARGLGIRACAHPPGTVRRPGDCDDGDPARHPTAVETPRDGIDQDCDGHG